MFLLSPTHPALLEERVRCAEAANPALITDVITDGRRRTWPPTSSKRLGQLICVGAWADAALLLIELEIPQWKIRRLAYDDGKWCCALSRQRELPDWLDQAVEGHHTRMELAILSALIEARRQADHMQAIEAPRTSPEAAKLFEPMLSDNFS